MRTVKSASILFRAGAKGHGSKYLAEKEYCFCAFNLDEALWPFSARDGAHALTFVGTDSSSYVCGGEVHTQRVEPRGESPLCVHKEQKFGPRAGQYQ